MNSLRQEIENIILSDRTERWNSTEHKQQTNDIIIAIEKRIDEEITEPYCKARIKGILK